MTTDAHTRVWFPIWNEVLAGDDLPPGVRDHHHIGIIHYLKYCT